MDKAGGQSGLAVEGGPRVVERELCCVRCGYSLRGLPVEGKCPECGGEVRRSLMGDLLIFADAAYVKRLRMGAILAEAGIVLVLCVIYGGLAAVVAFATAGSSPWRGIEAVIGMVVSAGALGFGFLSLGGWMLLSTPDPASLMDQGVTARRVVRWSVIATAGAWFVATAVGAVSLAGGGGGPAVAPMVVSVMRWMGFLGLAGVVAQLLGASAYMQHMARRVRCEALGKAARSLRVLTIATAAVGCVAWAMAAGSVFPAAAVPLIAAYGCFAVMAGKYASVVDLARREIGLAARVAEGVGESEEVNR
jgi:hypothetical protein